MQYCLEKHGHNGIQLASQLDLFGISLICMNHAIKSKFLYMVKPQFSHLGNGHGSIYKRWLVVYCSTNKLCQEIHGA